MKRDKIKEWAQNKQFSTIKEALWAFEKETGENVSVAYFYRHARNMDIIEKHRSRIFRFLNENSYKHYRTAYSRYTSQFECSIVYFERLYKEWKKTRINSVAK